MHTTNPNLPIAFKAYMYFVAAATLLFQSVFLLTIRIIWGWQFFMAGKGKLANLDRVAHFFGDDLHIPFPKFNAILASTTETFGGLLLIVGLAGRLVSLPLTFTMLVAYWTAERPDIHSLDDFVKATPFPFLFTSLVVLCFGPGKLSADYLIGRFILKRKMDNDMLPGFEVVPTRI